MMTDRVDYDEAGELDEIVSTRGAHLERLGPKQWFLSFQHADGTETVVWFKSKHLKKPLLEKRPPSRIKKAPPAETKRPCPECGLPHGQCDPEGVGHYRG